jgi:hypothetical protein
MEMNRVSALARVRQKTQQRFQMLLDMEKIDAEIGEDTGYRGFANSAKENVKLLQGSSQMCRLVLKGLINLPWVLGGQGRLHTTRFLASEEIHAQRCYPITCLATLSPVHISGIVY